MSLSVQAPSIIENVARVRERIAAAAVRAGRDPAAVTLCAVTKTVEPARVLEVIAAGVQVLGENYVQEARTKIPEVEGETQVPIAWHLIGHLQSNKAKYSVSLFSCIHSVDKEGLIAEIGKQSIKIDKEQEVLIEVNLAGSDARAGVLPAELPVLVRKVQSTRGVLLRGLMGMAPAGETPEDARPHFRLLRRLFDEELPEECRHTLSMGMSGDFEMAVEEGATLVRLGTALFGARSYGATR